MEENSIYSSWQEGELGRCRGSFSTTTPRAGTSGGPISYALCLQWASFRWWCRGPRQPPAAS